MTLLWPLPWGGSPQVLITMGFSSPYPHQHWIPITVGFPFPYPHQHRVSISMGFSSPNSLHCEVPSPISPCLWVPHHPMSASPCFHHYRILVPTSPWFSSPWRPLIPVPIILGCPSLCPSLHIPITPRSPASYPHRGVPISSPSTQAHLRSLQGPFGGSMELHEGCASLHEDCAAV